MWYICAMTFRILTLCAALVVLAQTVASVPAQTGGRPENQPSVSSPLVQTGGRPNDRTLSPSVAGQTGGRSDNRALSPPASVQTGGRSFEHRSASTASTAVSRGAGDPAASADTAGGPDDITPSHITVANPPALTAPWPLHERIAWIANLLLAILGYAGILLALSILKDIQRQTRYAETAATAAAESAQAALLHAQAIVQSERPWILIMAEPSANVENGFVVTATNRGRTPAQIVALADEISIAADEAHLPSSPRYAHGEPSAPLVPIYLLPGESKGIKNFCRDDVRALCASEEKFQRVENWEEKIFLYGKVIYQDLIAPAGEQTHETAWCCWYIHGRQKSGLVMAGPAGYNTHS